MVLMCCIGGYRGGTYTVRSRADDPEGVIGSTIIVVEKLLIGRLRGERGFSTAPQPRDICRRRAISTFHDRISKYKDGFRRDRKRYYDK